MMNSQVIGWHLLKHTKSYELRHRSIACVRCKRIPLGGVHVWFTLDVVTSPFLA